MTSLFDRVPFDIWHQIALELDTNDYIHLSRTNRRLYSLLKDEVTARKAAQVRKVLWNDNAGLKRWGQRMLSFFAVKYRPYFRGNPSIQGSDHLS